MLLIDAYNVLCTEGVLPTRLTGLNLAGLGDLILASRYRARPVRLVCDGEPPSGSQTSHARQWEGLPLRTRGTASALRVGLRAELVGTAAGSAAASDLRILYAGAGHQADDLIGRLVDASSAPRRLLVVSSDRRVRAMARKRRAQDLTSEEFLRQLAYDESSVPAAPRRPAFARQIPLDSYSISYWMDHLGVDPETAAIAPANAPTPANPARDAPPPPAIPDAPKPPSSSPGSGVQIDPLVLDALEEWAGRLSLDDLDMSRWLTDAPPPSRTPAPPAPPAPASPGKRSPRRSDRRARG